MFLLATVCCNTLFVSATTPKKSRQHTQDSPQSVQTQQRTIIDRLNRIEYKLEEKN